MEALHKSPGLIKRKFTPLVKKQKCWLEDLVVEQDYCCKNSNVFLNHEALLISIHQNCPPSHLDSAMWDHINIS